MTPTGSPAARAAAGSKAVKTSSFQQTTAPMTRTTSTVAAANSARGTSSPRIGTVSKGTSSRIP